MKSGNFMGSRTKKTGVALPTRSLLFVLIAQIFLQSQIVTDCCCCPQTTLLHTPLTRSPAWDPVGRCRRASGISATEGGELRLARERHSALPRERLSAVSDSLISADRMDGKQTSGFPSQ